jgi:hypothetical protein
VMPGLTSNFFVYFIWYPCHWNFGSVLWRLNSTRPNKCKFISYYIYLWWHFHLYMSIG